MINEPFLNKEINIRNVIYNIEQKLPKAILSNIKEIYVGQFEELKQRQVQSLYEDGAIFLSSEIEGEKELVLSIIHEMAHALEETQRDKIYSDGLIEKEFLAKRATLFNILKTNGHVNGINLMGLFFKPEYDIKFDNFLNKTITYPVLSGLSSGLFLSPYAITSIREYFANAFEKFFSGHSEEVKKITPSVYNKLVKFI